MKNVAMVVLLSVLVVGCESGPLDGNWTVTRADYASEGCFIPGYAPMPLPVSMEIRGDAARVTLADGDVVALDVDADGAMTGHDAEGLLEAGDAGELAVYLGTSVEPGVECWVEFYVVRS